MLQLSSTAQMISVIHIIGTAVHCKKMETARTWVEILKDSTERFMPEGDVSRLRRCTERLNAALATEMKSDRAMSDLLRQCLREVSAFNVREPSVRFRRTKGRSSEQEFSGASWMTGPAGVESGWGTEAPSTSYM